MVDKDSTYKYWPASKKREHTARKNRTVNTFRHDYKEGELLSKEALAFLLYRTPKTIQNWVTTQDLPRVRVDHMYFFVRSEVVRWAEYKPFISKEEFLRLRNFTIDLEE